MKFLGVPVGRVTGINSQIDPRDESFPGAGVIPINLPRHHVPAPTQPRDTLVLRQHVDKGCAPTAHGEPRYGVLIRAVSLIPRRPHHSLVTEFRRFPPAVTQAAIGGGAGSLLSETMKILNRVNGLLGDVNMREINVAVVRSAKAVEELVNAPEIRATLRQMPGATAQLTSTLAEAQRLAARASLAIDSIQPGVKGASTEAVATLQALRKTLDETHGLLSADTGPGYALTDALKSLREAADALKLLITSLEQNPDMLIRGKKPPEKK